ncbi:MAG: helix-turn-helix domain-containing protein [Clostridiales bacterium]|nr:helix-turn-helix domain-containing protein [Clostridiales bacterium]
MTEDQKSRIKTLRENGVGYVRIAQTLGLSQNTVSSYCRRNGLAGTKPPAGQHLCRYCGCPVEQTKGRKEKKFCSDSCRMKWWNSHLDKVNRKANYEFICPHCKKTFTAYGNSNRKYCSHECYVADRFGGGADE